VLEQLVVKVPPPQGDPEGPLQALIIDSWFDSYLGVVSLVRVVHGCIRRKQKITIMSTGKSFIAEKVGVFTPKRLEKELLNTGEVGYVVAGIKDIFGAPVGDTITWTDKPALEQLTGFQRVQPRVFAGLYPVSSDNYEDLREALKKLNLNDAALQFEP
jgi:GTP-binding protein LepA